jgi:hypothetical protein
MKTELSEVEKAERTYLMQLQLDVFRYVHGYRPLDYEEFVAWVRSAKGEAILEKALQSEAVWEAEMAADDAAADATGGDGGDLDEASYQKLWGETYTKAFDQVLTEELDKVFAEDRS